MSDDASASTSTEWSREIRPGWLISTRPPYGDGYLYGVRNFDGHVAEATTRQRLMARMMAADIVATWREADRLQTR